jgi:hypothetical protein
MRNTILTTVGVVLAASFIASAAQAASPAFCTSYATKALIAEQENLDEGCGFSGVRWSFDFAGHYGWCLSVSKAVANGEKMARKFNLLACEGY